MSESPSAVTNDVGDLGESKPALEGGIPGAYDEDGEALSATMFMDGILGGSSLFDDGIAEGWYVKGWEGMNGLFREALTACQVSRTALD